MVRIGDANLKNHIDPRSYLKWHSPHVCLLFIASGSRLLKAYLPITREEAENETSSILTLDSHISCGSHCWWRCGSCWLADVLSSMRCVQRVEWEGEDGGWASGSLSPQCDVTIIGHCSVITGVQPLNSWWYIRLNSTGQVVGLPSYWYTRAHNGGVVQQLCRK